MNDLVRCSAVAIVVWFSVAIASPTDAADEATPPPSGAAAFGPVHASGLDWIHYSSRNGDLPAPAGGTEQTGCVVGDLAKDGVNGFVLSFRKVAPALVWYRHGKSGWERYVIDKDMLQVEAGGAICDIDGDGYPDIVFGGDYQSGEVWWWRNPGGHYDPNVPWERHLIKAGGSFISTTIRSSEILREPESRNWSFGTKRAGKLMIADIPADPLHTNEWPASVVFDGKAQTQGGRVCRRRCCRGY